MADAKYSLHNPPPPERRALTPPPPPPPQGRHLPPPPPTTSPGYKAPPPPPQQHAIRRPPSPPQDNREIDWRTIVALVVIALVVAGAYGGYSYWKYARGLLPREDETRAKLVAMVPTYVKVDSLKIKSTDATTFQYEATVSPLEDLYASEAKRPDLGVASSVASPINPPVPPSPITLLKRTSKQGEPLLVYGKILAHKSDDLWHVSDVTIDSGLEQLGRPRSAFIADATVEGTPEATAAIAKLEKATTDYKSAIQALIAQQSTQTEKERREALAAAEKARQDALVKAQAAKAQLDAAITAGNAYRGVLMFSDGQTQEILFSIAEHTGLVLKAEAMNPDNPQQKQSFAGTILSETSDDPDSYPITFSPVARQNLSGAWDFYNQSGVLKLRPSSDGLEGTCQMQSSGWGGNSATYKLKLQKVDPATVVQILNPSAPGAANSPPVAGQSWTNSLGVKFVPAGTDGVLFSVWDVRVKDFKAFVDATGYDATAGMYSAASDGWKQQGDTWKSPGFTQTEDHPVVGVSWNDAKAFCQWLTKKEQQEGKLGANQEYRLPTDAEWSQAVGLQESREGTPGNKSGKIPGVYPWGRNWPPPQGAGNYAGSEARDGKWPSTHSTIDGYDDGYPRTSPVGSFKPNAYGLYDMGGNVWQWCENTYDVEHDWRVLRGGGWTNKGPDALLSSYRDHDEPNRRYDGVGFRVVVVVNSLTPPAAPSPAQGPVAGQPWTNSLGVQFVPAGTDGVLFSVWDVRVKDFKAFVDATGYDATGGIYEIGSDDKQLSDSWKSPGFTQGEDHPVVGVNWGDAKAFCQWLTKKEQVEGRLASNQKYRLPTDAEWSKAVGLNESRGGTPQDKDRKIKGVYPWGTQWPPPQGAGNYAGSEARDAQWPSNLRTIADYDDGYPRTSPVGSFSANKYGLYDMSGNVCQWCEDKYDSEHDDRMVRGASWVGSDSKDLLSSNRSSVDPGIRNGVYGFRVVVVVSP